MFKLANERALLQTFRPADRRLVELTREVSLPMRVDDYLTWVHGRRVYLVFAAPPTLAAPGAEPKGIVFQSDAGGPSVPRMCEWCHEVAFGTRVGLLTARRDRKRTAGVLVCADLGCRERIEDRADRRGEDARPAMAKVLARMERFALGLDFDSREDPERS